jgi:hypothetical protein
MLKKTYLALLLMAATFVLGQGRTREIGLITENDLYTSSKNVLYKWLEIFIGFSEEWHRESQKKLLSLELVSYSITHNS